MKTIKEHLQDLPEPHRHQALSAAWWEDLNTKQPDIKKALYQAFNWSKSPQGYRYWKDLHDKL
jgi:hypothetical protein